MDICLKYRMDICLKYRMDIESNILFYNFIIIYILSIYYIFILLSLPKVYLHIYHYLFTIILFELLFF
jgi:hypothetical protein